MCTPLIPLTVKCDQPTQKFRLPFRNECDWMDLNVDFSFLKMPGEQKVHPVGELLEFFCMPP